MALNQDTESQGVRAATGEPIEMLLNMGPQHPSTHGVFRLVLWVDGEKIVDLEPHIGYLHRGSEKLSEGEQYAQVITLFDRMDYIANFNNELAFCMAVEKLMGLEVPERAEYAAGYSLRAKPDCQPPAFRGHYGARRGRHDPVHVLLPGPRADTSRYSRPFPAPA